VTCPPTLEGLPAQSYTIMNFITTIHEFLARIPRNNSLLASKFHLNNRFFNDIAVRDHNEIVGASVHAARAASWRADPWYGRFRETSRQGPPRQCIRVLVFRLDEKDSFRFATTVESQIKCTIFMLPWGLPTWRGWIHPKRKAT
jgi:hypothetical protein